MAATHIETPPAFLCAIPYHRKRMYHEVTSRWQFPLLDWLIYLPGENTHTTEHHQMTHPAHKVDAEVLEVTSSAYVLPSSALGNLKRGSVIPPALTGRGGAEWVRMQMQIKEDHT